MEAILEIDPEDICKDGHGHKWVEDIEYDVLEKRFFILKCKKCKKLSSGWKYIADITE